MFLLGAPAYAQSDYPVSGSLQMSDAQGGTIEDGVCVGDLVHVKATGWKGGTGAKAEYFSDAVQIGTFTANPNGEVDFAFNVPNAQPVPGNHTFRLSGTGANGQPRTVEGPIKCLGCGQPPGTGTGGTGAGTGSGSGAGNGTGLGSGNGSGAGSGNGSGSGSGSNVLGKTTDNASNANSGSVFGKTGADIVPILEVAAALLAIGTALVLAVRKRRAADTVA